MNESKVWWRLERWLAADPDNEVSSMFRNSDGEYTVQLEYGKGEKITVHRDTLVGAVAYVLDVAEFYAA